MNVVNPLIKIIDVTQWKKEDPTEYDGLADTIFVRSTYDIENDPEGWLVHERIHAYLASINFEDNDKSYPFNNVERHAYTWQFVYLLELGWVKTINDIERFMPWKFKRYGEEWANDYFNRAQAKIRNDNPNIPPNMIHGGGKFESCAELQLEEIFREIVDDAKRKISPKSSSRVDEKSQTSVEQNNTNGKGCIAAIVVVAILTIALAVYCTL